MVIWYFTPPPPGLQSLLVFTVLPRCYLTPPGLQSLLVFTVLPRCYLTTPGLQSLLVFTVLPRCYLTPPGLQSLLVFTVLPRCYLTDAGRAFRLFAQGSIHFIGWHSKLLCVFKKTECDYLNSWIKKQTNKQKRSHTQTSHPKMVNPRQKAGYCRKRRRRNSRVHSPPSSPSPRKHSKII